LKGGVLSVVAGIGLTRNRRRIRLKDEGQ